MRTAIICLSCSAALVAGAAAAAEPTRLEAQADAVTVPVARLAGRNEYISLPALEFNLTIDAACPDGASAESLTISVADTRKRMNGTDIGESVQTKLSLPRRQSVRIRVEDFCREGDRPGVAQSLLVTDVFTARLSLRCAVEDRQSIVYATLPLDVELECEAEIGSGSNQDDSSSEPVASLSPRNSSVRSQAVSAASAL